jgi:hypothetical protein
LKIKALCEALESYAKTLAASGGASGLHSAHDVLKVADAAGKPINPGEHENVAAAKEIENGPQFLAAFRRGAGAFLSSDHFATRRLQGSLLN